MIMTLHQIEIFYAIVEEQGFAAAGDKLLLSQPSISSQLKSFETSLGLVLIDREQSTKTNGIVLTEEGRFVFDVAQRMLSEYEQLSEYIKNRTTISSIRIVSNSAIGTYLLPKMVANFYSTNPDIKIELSIEPNFDRLIKICKGTLYDLCIAPLNTDTLTKNNVVYSFKLPILLVTANEDFYLKGKLSLNDLYDLPLILPAPDSVTRKALNLFFPQLEHSKNFIELDHPEITKRMLLSNKKYFALLSSIALSEETKAPFYVIQTDPPLPHIDHRIYVTKKPLKYNVRHFLEYLESHLPSNQYPTSSCR